jgi:UDP-3-O-[3-hydroxymyristoyl] glucosamine N-acyltransferase
MLDYPRETFIKILGECFPYKINWGEVHPSSTIDKEADIHPSVYIGPQCVIGKCKIGENTVIHPNTVIFDDVKIGKNVIIGPDCVIGYDGFSYDNTDKDNLKKFLHYGGVTIEDDVELYAKVIVVRGTIDDTLIQKGTKIGNFCNVGHNVITGRHNQITVGVMIGGNTTLGDYVFLAPYAVIRNGIKVGKNALVGMGAVVTKDVKEDTVVFGNPARPKS